MPELSQAEQTLVSLLDAYGGRAPYSTVLAQATYRHPLTVADAAFWSLVRDGKINRCQDGVVELSNIPKQGGDYDG